MELNNEFVIERPVDETWAILNDLEFIAPCMPGAKLTEIEGDEYRGTVKVKVGPITAQYKGKASFLEQDATNHVAKLKAEGRDPRQGNANALVSAKMEPEGDGATKVMINTDLKLSGKVASFGRGVIEDISLKILGQFVDNLREKLETEGTPGAETAADDEAPKAESNGAASTADDADAPKIRKIEGPEAEAVDLLAVTGDPIAKRLAPVLAGAVLLLILRWLLRGRA